MEVLPVQVSLDNSHKPLAVHPQWQCHELAVVAGLHCEQWAHSVLDAGAVVPKIAAAVAAAGGEVLLEHFAAGVAISARFSLARVNCGCPFAIALDDQDVLDDLADLDDQADRHPKY